MPDQNEASAAKDLADEKAKAIQELESKMSGLERQVSNLQQEVDKKEQKLISRQKSIADLMSKMDSERNNFDIKLKGR